MRPSALIIICGIVSAASTGCANAKAVAQSAELFDSYDIVTPAAAHQTLLTGSFIDGEAAQVVLLTVDDKGQRNLRLYAFDGTDWRLRHTSPFPADILYVDVATLAGHDRLVGRTPRGFLWLDPATGAQHPVTELAASFHTASDTGVPRLDVFRDLNGDGREDLIVPDVDGFRVALQSLDGSFGPMATLGPPEPFRDARAYGDERTYAEVGVTAQNVPWYLSRVHHVDVDRDGRDDLAFWNTDHFMVYRQDENGRFRQTPETFTTDVAIDFDGAYGLAFQFGDRSVPGLLLGFGRRIEHRILHGLRDLNGDGVADLVILALAGRSPLRLRGRYDVHFGRPTEAGIYFPPSADTVVRAPGRSGGLQPWGYAAQHYLDFDGDGALDMGMAAVNTGLFGMFRAMVGNSISMDLALYRLNDDGRYPSEPDVNLRLGTPFSPLDGRGPLFPTVLVGDVDGDGRTDLVAGERWDELSVYLGGQGSDPLSSEPIPVPTDVPSDERNARLVDLDRDGKQDVVIQHPSAAQDGRIAILVAR